MDLMSFSARRRKKKCIRYSENSDQPGAERDNLGSVGSAEAQTPDSKSANESDVDNLNLSSAELSLSSPPVPNSDPHHLSLLPLSHRVMTHHQSLAHSHFLQRNSPSSASSSSSSLAALSGPPRNSPIGPNNPLSIEQLTRPHIRPSPVTWTSFLPSSHLNLIFIFILILILLPPSTNSSSINEQNQQQTTDMIYLKQTPVVFNFYFSSSLSLSFSLPLFLSLVSPFNFPLPFLFFSLLSSPLSAHFSSCFTVHLKWPPPQSVLPFSRLHCVIQCHL